MTIQLPCEPKMMIAKLNEGVCPYCEKAGFKKIFTHLGKKHGISPVELKDALLINRNKGFCDPDTKELLRKNALKNHKSGFYGKGRAKGSAPSNITIQKQKLAWENNLEWQNHFKNLMKDPEIAKRSTETRRENGTFRILGQKRAEFLYGTVAGYPDEIYVGYAIEFISELSKSGGWGVYVRLGEKWGVHETSAKKRINVANKRGLLNTSGSGGFLRAELTEKALMILDAKPDNHGEIYNVAIQQGK